MSDEATASTDAADPWPEAARHLEGRIDAQEQILANLMVCYLELSVAVEQLLHQTLSPLSDAERAHFAAETLRFKQQMFAGLEEMSKSYGATLDGGHGIVSATLAGMAGLADTGDGDPEPGPAAEPAAGD